jgi:hypothetical protein
MKIFMRFALPVLIVIAVVVAVAATSRVMRVRHAAAGMPTYPGSTEAGGRIRYFPRLISWDDRSSARVQRVFALSERVNLATVARYADSSLAAQGWYLVLPEELHRIEDPQVVVWQREPDERLDLVQLWPVRGMTAEQRLYGGVFPAEFLDRPMVIEWSWALGGSRSAPRPPSSR